MAMAFRRGRSCATRTGPSEHGEIRTQPHLPSFRAMLGVGGRSEQSGKPRPPPRSIPALLPACPNGRTPTSKVSAKSVTYPGNGFSPAARAIASRRVTVGAPRHLRRRLPQPSRTGVPDGSVDLGRIRPVVSPAPAPAVRAVRLRPAVRPGPGAPSRSRSRDWYWTWSSAGLSSTAARMVAPSGCCARPRAPDRRDCAGQEVLVPVRENDARGRHSLAWGRSPRAGKRAGLRPPHRRCGHPGLKGEKVDQPAGDVDTGGPCNPFQPGIPFTSITRPCRPVRQRSMPA